MFNIKKITIVAIMLLGSFYVPIEFLSLLFKDISMGMYIGIPSGIILFYFIQRKICGTRLIGKVF